MDIIAPNTTHLYDILNTVSDFIVYPPLVYLQTHHHGKSYTPNQRRTGQL